MGYQTAGSGTCSSWCTRSSKQKVGYMVDKMRITIRKGLLQKTALLGIARILRRVLER